MERAFKTCLDLVSQKKTYSTDKNLLKRKPASEYYQMLPHYEGKYEPRQKNFVFEAAKEILIKEVDKLVAKTRFERIIIAIETMNYTKYEDIPENKEMIICGFKPIKINKIDNFIIFGCESGELSEKDKLRNSWSNKFINEEIKKENSR